MKEDSSKFILKIFEWLAEIKKELFDFYVDSDTDYKLSPINEEWFHELEIIDLSIEIREGNIYNQIAVSDHVRGFGFYLETEDNEMVSLEYDPIL